MSVLFLATPLQRNRSSWTSNLLLNSNRVATIQKDDQYPLSRCKLFYCAAPNGSNGTTEFLLSSTMNTIASRMGGEDETNRVVKLQVVNYQLPGSRGKTTATSNNKDVWEIGVEQIIYGYDISTTQAKLLVNRGLDVIVLTVSHTVADISRSVSRSQSLSRS